MNSNEKQQHDESPSSTYEELRDLQDSLRRPLTDRPVLIPMGPHAFVPGRLRPRQKTQQKHDVGDDEGDVSSKDSKEKEIVSVSCGGKEGLKDMTRAEAIAYFQSEMDRFKTKKPAIKKSKPPPVPNEESIDALDDTTQQPQIAMFDIREELNDHGQVVKSEAINVTKQLKEWEEQIHQAKADNMDDIGESKTPETETTTLDGDIEVMDDGEDTGKGSVSDQEYESLAARLDELARLEEEAEQEEQEKEIISLRAKLNPTKTVKKPSSSSGWAKGFLNKTKQSTASKTPTKTPTKTTPPKKQTEQDSSSTGKQTQQPKAKETVTSNNTPMNAASARKVGFSDQTEVQEIPRVGERSVSSIQRPPSRPIEGTSTIQRPPSKPIEGTSLFSGVVRERKTNRKKKNVSTQQQQQAGDKPLSLFAQQRQQMGGQP